jgi:hypothetical protein
MSTMRTAEASLADACAKLMAHGVSTKLMTPAEMVTEIAARERAPRREGVPRDDDALTRACVEALRSSGESLPSIPLRVVRGWSPNGTPLPKTWGVLIERDETPVAFAPLPAPFVGFIAAVARITDLPRPVLDPHAKRRIASALADAILAQIHSK